MNFGNKEDNVSEVFDSANGSKLRFFISLHQRVTDLPEVCTALLVEIDPSGIREFVVKKVTANVGFKRYFDCIFNYNIIKRTG